MFSTIAGRAPAPTGDTAPDPARPAPRGTTRRNAVRGLAACALAAPLAPVAAAPRTGHEAQEAGATAGHPGFEETYRGRRIRGVRTPAGRTAGEGHWEVTVDGRPLHLMRRADGTWLSMVDHYRPYRTPVEAVRAAVDELGPRTALRGTVPGAMGAAHTRTGDGHGVRA
ncbi:tyrosinase family oxidase copper chaperone [Streptomyces sp. NPDC004065]|uniref:tyrosinase family oxidase copper chaperone n=1 Tax=Streptomyces sp. NPDC004065 TaxID=3364689 RepID=UPI00384D1C03